MKIGLLGFGFMGRTHAWCLDNLKYFYGAFPFRAEIAGVPDVVHGGAGTGADNAAALVFQPLKGVREEVQEAVADLVCRIVAAHLVGLVAQ